MLGITLQPLVSIYLAKGEGDKFEPSQIRKPEHMFKMMEIIEAQIDVVYTQAEKDAIKEKAHREVM
jgi:hypothetical protein